MLCKIRKIVVQFDEIHMKNGQSVHPPSRRALDGLR